jgi:hypothetical protein
MIAKGRTLALLALLASLITVDVAAQGTFQNLDFENGSFVPIPGQFNTVEFGPAMPGWTGFVGTNQVNWILHNSLFLSTAGLAIWGPDNPSVDFLRGHFYVVLQRGQDLLDPLRTVSSGISQIGTVPTTAQSIRFLSLEPFVMPIQVSFNGVRIPLYNLGGNANGSQTWGGEISPFIGQTGELRFFGEGHLDFIQFSNEPIPEPSVFGLFAFGALLLGWLWRKTWKL